MYSKFAKLRNRSASWTRSWGFSQPDVNVITEVHVDNFLLVISTASLNSIVMFCGRKPLGTSYMTFFHCCRSLPKLVLLGGLYFVIQHGILSCSFEFVLCSINYVISGICIFSEFLSQSKRACYVYGMFFCQSLVLPVRTVYKSLP
jgi:hypothetical protein